MKETPLKGGRTNPAVTLKDGKVYRSAGENADFVHRFLEYTKSIDLNIVPQFLGIDDAGREILSYIPGVVPNELGHFSDEQLLAAARLINQLHEASTGFSGLSDEVVCHNDLSPCNFVFQSDLPIAIIDFDAAKSGKRMWDLAYALWLWLDLGSSETSAQEQGRRIKLFCQSYGISAHGVLETIQSRQEFHIQQNSASNPATSQWAKNCLEWMKRNREALVRAVS